MTDSLRVLIVEDSITDEKLILRELGRHGREIVSRRVETAGDMLAVLASKPWDIVLSDWSMPHFSALEALVTLRQSGSDVPFIIVSGTIGEDAAVEGMRSGAQDYVLKDNLARLLPAVDREMRDYETRVAMRLAEIALHGSEARFARLAESGIIAISVADVNGKVDEANDAFLTLVGYTREELISGDVEWSRITMPDASPEDAIALQELQERGFLLPLERELLRKDGSRVPALVGAAMLDGSKLIAFYADLTSKKLTEEALKRSEEQFRSAQKLEAIGFLAGGVAHDFNNLLSVILSYASMLASDITPGDPMEEGLGEIKEAGFRAAALTGQLLAFSRGQRLKPQIVDLNEVVAQMESMLRRLIGEDVELIKVISASLPSVYVDAGQIEQVIMNLAVNARDALPNGGKIVIETEIVMIDEAFVGEHVGMRPGPHVMLSVSDNGSGMDAGTQARVFEPFFTTKEVGHGTGLGLSTVFGIVQQSGGTIWLYSEVGSGTSFRIYLPAIDEPAAPRAREMSSPRSLDGSETILLVEDEEGVRRIASTILRRRGYNVLEAAGGGDALLISEQHSAAIDLLITDVIMPRMNGRQLAERLKPIRPNLRVLFMSGYTANAISRHGVFDPDVDFLQKPITPESLAEAVRRCLDAPPRQRAAVATPTT